MKPLVSVVVPIYNVSRWLHQCLDSLKKQTMKDIEIVMIDDGSTDGSGDIADKYCDDPRFRCFHTENHGLSAARNRGIDEASAEYIMFVDSDDWVDEYYCEKPYKIAHEKDADIVIYQHRNVSPRGKIQNVKTNKTGTCGLVSKEIGIDIEGIVVWRKLYHRKLFDIIRFPEGLINEDILTTHKLIYKAERIYCINDSLYYYRKRRGSISHPKYHQFETKEFEARLQRCNELIAFGYPVDKAERQLQASALRYCGKSLNTNDNLYIYALMITNNIKGFPKEFNLKQKIILSIWRRDHSLFRFLYWLFRKRNGMKKYRIISKNHV